MGDWMFGFSWRGHTSCPVDVNKVVVEMGVSRNGVPPKWMVYAMENPIKIGDLGYPHFRKPPNLDLEASFPCMGTCGGFLKMWSTPIAGGFRKEHHIYKWMMTSGVPLFFRKPPCTNMFLEFVFFGYLRVTVCYDTTLRLAGRWAHSSFRPGCWTLGCIIFVPDQMEKKPMWGFPARHGGYPKWFIMENPIYKWMM